MPALDGVRGAAVAAVLLYHGGHLRGGYLGVDLFFVLSGYLITTLLLREWGRNRAIGLGHFWARRARRLFPALLLVMLGISVYAWLGADPTEMHGIRTDGLATLFYGANWHTIFAGQVYGDQFHAPSPFTHTWSLAIEEQFYVIWPIVVIGLLRLRSRPRIIMQAAVVAAIASVALMIGLHVTHTVSDNSLYLSTPTRLAAIAMGAALAAWQVKHPHAARPSTRYAIEGLALVSVAFLAFMWSRTELTSSFLYSGGLALCGLAGTVILLAVTHPRPLVLAPVLRLSPLQALGLISYGLYLWHWPIFVVVSSDRTHLHGWALFGVQVALSLAIAVLSYIVIERPIRYGAFTATEARAAGFSVAVIAVVALVASTMGGISSGQDLAKAARSSATAGSGGAGSTPLLLVGDSVAVGLDIDGLVPLRRELHVDVTSGAQVGCNYMASVGVLKGENGQPIGTNFARDCSPQYASLVAQARPSVVLLVLGNRPATSSVEVAGRNLYACDPAYQLLYRQRLTQIAGVLTSRGAVLVAATTPRAAGSGGNVVAVNKTVACQNDALRSVVTADPVHLRLIDLDAFVCPRGACQLKHGGAVLRADSMHFRGPGAKYVTRWLVPRALALAKARR
ncbi:MAG: putative acyltransferase [Acidimicrobiales bacterium]|nr:putative acyltransferase [Acidimicrobiales bacterium]